MTVVPEEYRSGSMVIACLQAHVHQGMMIKLRVPFLPRDIESRRLASLLVEKSLGGMVVQSDIENGNVRMLKLQALFSHGK